MPGEGEEECSGVPGSGDGSGDGSGEASKDSGDCPPSMIRGTCKPVCEQDCKPGPTCDGIQCGEVESCSCKAGYVLVSANNRDLGYVMVEECTDFN
ncbi:hypothetical protein Y032_0582g287 [Ancylostoma ceylanicum]|uniref:TIL domain-containing protein n=1 Tax=Ancylostoma ceylanicum TaxID=53326 RepID=A0A016WQ23_9BILA|nr:hypothetical protein Y032_0582g287 [Ancylostoma ceylanicum]